MTVTESPRHPKPRQRPRGVGSTTSRSSPPTWTRTVRFYHGVLGARLVATVGTPEFRHYFFEFGPQCTVAFFEYADATIEPFAKAAGVPDPAPPSSTTSHSTFPTSTRSTTCGNG